MQLVAVYQQLDNLRIKIDQQIYLIKKTFAGRSGCPLGVPMVYCFVSPCSVNTCPAYPSATCEDDYCGGCNAIFRDSSGNVLSYNDCNREK